MSSVRVRFADAVEQFGGYRAVAEKLGVTESYIGLLISGKGHKRPALDMAFRIEELLDIPARDWTDADVIGSDAA
jgi:transcriptional regulator with XRE-family HTH domain